MIAERHLQTRRPRKDRDVTWGRAYDSERKIIVWSLWRRDSQHAIHLKSVSAHQDDPPTLTHLRLRAGNRELRDFVDEIDLAAMEKRA